VRIIVLTLVALALTACGHTPARIETQIVQVPVPVPCVAKLDPAPAYADSDEAIAAAPDIFALAQIYRAGRGERIAREVGLVGVLRGCGGR
jgi:hypothetical protein